MHFSCFLSSAHFFQNQLFEQLIQECHQSVNSLDLDQARLFVGPDLGPNCLHRLSADDTSKQRVKLYIINW